MFYKCCTHCGFEDCIKRVPVDHCPRCGARLVCCAAEVAEVPKSKKRRRKSE